MTKARVLVDVKFVGQRCGGMTSSSFSYNLVMAEYSSYL